VTEAQGRFTQNCVLAHVRRFGRKSGLCSMRTLYLEQDLPLVTLSLSRQGRWDHRGDRAFSLGKCSKDFSKACYLTTFQLRRWYCVSDSGACIWSFGGMILTGKMTYSEKDLTQWRCIYHKSSIACWPVIRDAESGFGSKWNNFSSFPLRH